MVMLQSEIQLKDYLMIARRVASALVETAIERDAQAGIPVEEVKQIRDAGLLPLVVPQEYSGIGATWIEAFPILQELAKADGSTGQLFANQLILSVLPKVSGTPAQADHYFRITAQHHLFWGNAFNTRDMRLQIKPDGDGYRVDGIKTFGTGVIVADLRVFAAMQEGVDYPVVFIVPRDREGIVYNNDWNNMGQRRTASGSFTFNNVRVMPDEILGPPPNPTGAFATLLFVINQLAKTHVYLGIAEGAFEAAIDYTTTTTRAWITSGVDRASQDPYILRHYGELSAQLQAAIALSRQATQQVQIAWEKGDELTHEERGEVAIAVYCAKVMATQVGLKITHQIFEVMGARATATQHGFDRYWRDLRTFTLHDPLDYKLRDIGNWLLNGELPMPSQYS